MFLLVEKVKLLEEIKLKLKMFITRNIFMFKMNQVTAGSRLPGQSQQYRDNDFVVGCGY